MTPKHLTTHVERRELYTHVEVRDGDRTVAQTTINPTDCPNKAAERLKHSYLMLHYEEEA